MNVFPVQPIRPTLMATGMLTMTVIQIAPTDYVRWLLNTTDDAEIFTDVVRVLVTRFLGVTSDRPKNMSILTNSKLMAPFLNFCVDGTYLAYEGHSVEHERAAGMHFYRSFMSLAQIVTRDCIYLKTLDFPLEFVPTIFLNEFESAFIHYTTWIEVNARPDTRYEMATEIMYRYTEEKQKRGTVDPLGLFPMYRTVLSHLWGRPLKSEDYLLLDAIGTPAKKGRAVKKTPAGPLPK